MRLPPTPQFEALIDEQGYRVREVSPRLCGVASESRYLRWISAAVGKFVKLIAVDEICYFKADNKYTLVATPISDCLIRRPISDLAQALDPDLFWRIHRSTLVNVHAIDKVGRDCRGLSVQLKHRREALSVSGAYTHLFRPM